MCRIKQRMRAVRAYAETRQFAESQPQALEVTLPELAVEALRVEWLRITWDCHSASKLTNVSLIKLDRAVNLVGRTEPFYSFLLPNVHVS